jgi:very-short-patch-repair endonuclease
MESSTDTMCALFILKRRRDEVHQEVLKYAEAFETKMERAGRSVRLNENELRFLDQVYGPEFSFNFQGLTAQMPFIDYKGGERFVDFSYESGPIRLLIEVDSLKYHVEGITHQQYDDHQERQNDMILLGGWALVRFTSNMIAKRPMVCRRQLIQAVGKCLIMAKHHHISTEEQLWQKRKHEIVRLAGEVRKLKPRMVIERYNVSPKTATSWIRKIVAEGELVPVRSDKLVTGYTLPTNAKTDAAK